jgi:hypothetical protein
MGTSLLLFSVVQYTPIIGSTKMLMKVGGKCHAHYCVVGYKPTESLEWGFAPFSSIVNLSEWLWILVQVTLIVTPKLLD